MIYQGQMRDFFQNLIGPDPHLISIAKDYREVAMEQRVIIQRQQAEIVRLKLEYTRWGKGIIENFLIGLDRPEDEEGMRDLLALALVDMSDEIARIEEYAP